MIVCAGGGDTLGLIAAGVRPAGHHHPGPSTSAPSGAAGFTYARTCSQKQSLLFSEYLDELLLLALPHRQFAVKVRKILSRLLTIGRHRQDSIRAC